MAKKEIQMYKVATLIITIVLLASCGICRHCPCKGSVSVRDSVAIHWKDSVRIKDSLVVRDSVFAVPLPTESSSSVIPTILPSHLETSIAESDAFVDSLGLHHTLKNKDGSLEAHVPVTEHHHYEEHYQQKNSTATHSEIKPIEVEKELTWWQTFRIKAFWWLILALVVTNIKSILKLLKLL